MFSFLRNSFALTFRAQPVASITTQVFQQTRGMKLKTAIKKLCSGCYTVRRKGRVYNYCKTNHKHKHRTN